MSTDDLDDLNPKQSGPLDGDLLDGIEPAEAGAAPLIEGESTEDLATTTVAEKPTEEPPPEEPVEKGPGLLDKLAQSNPYTVMLVVSAVALFVAILCLLLEWGAYGFDVKASGATQSASAAASVDAGKV